MKMNLKLLAMISMIALFNFSGCQQEVTEIIDTPPAQVITPGSNVADLIERTSLRDGSNDNIIDNSSCTSLVLPITVMVNGLEIVLDSEEDFVTVEHIIDEFDDDEDVIEIYYPITVVQADHSEILINNEDDFEVLLDLCTEDGSDDDIECIDFVYPFTVSVFDSENQLSEVLTIKDDKDLYDFFDDFDEDEIASFNFPVTVILPDGQEYSVNNNDELENFLEDAIDACDEDDDNDHNDDDVDDTDLRSVLLDGEWIITYFFDDEDETFMFNGYVFDFLEDGTAEAIKDGQSQAGNWNTNGDDGTLELVLDFGMSDPFDELEDDWDVIEFDGTFIKLQDVSGGDGSVEYLTFERPTGNDDGNDDDMGSGDDGDSDPSSLANILIEGTWIVANFNDSGEDETSDYSGFSFDFQDDGSIVATRNDDTIDGTWSVFTDSGKEKLGLDFGEMVPLDEFTDDWDIQDVQNNRVELYDVSSGDGTTDVLVFEKEGA
jgi:hypothetical protein